MTPSGQTLDGLKSLRQSQQLTRLLSSETPLQLLWSVGNLRHGLKRLLTYPSAANMANATEDSRLGPTSITLASDSPAMQEASWPSSQPSASHLQSIPYATILAATSSSYIFSIPISSRLPPNLAPPSQPLPEFYTPPYLPAARTGPKLLLAPRSSSATGLPDRSGWKVGARQSLGWLS